MKKEWIEIPDDELNFYEEMLVALLGTLAPDGYNLREGGGNGKWCEEVKQKMSESHAGRSKTYDHKKKISESLAGRSKTDDHKKKISESLFKKVYQYDLNGTLVQSFESIEEATQSLNKTDMSNIGKCANGKRNSAYGFKWSFTEL